MHGGMPMPNVYIDRYSSFSNVNQSSTFHLPTEKWRAFFTSDASFYLFVFGFRIEKGKRLIFLRFLHSIRSRGVVIIRLRNL
jgi:hypothetical protein